MNNYYSLLVNRVRKTAFFIPFTVYLVIFVVCIVFFGQISYGKNINSDSSYAEILNLLVKIALFFSAILLLFSFLFVCISWGYFIYKKKKTGILFSLETANNSNENFKNQTIHISVNPIFKPILGFVKIRLQFDRTHFSKKFSLIENKTQKNGNKQLEGIYHWNLLQIKEYKLNNAIIYFEDVFQFFSLAATIPVAGQFFKHPNEMLRNDIGALPRLTEETNTKIDQIRKVEGEFLNYKNFENNDDVRRIVWKIYAKNKELVVRTPEIMDPYASHICLYPSFFSSFSIDGNETIEIPFLNFYKIMVWSAYQNLLKQGYEVQYIPDGHDALKNVLEDQQEVKLTISASNWHQSKDLKSYIQTNSASVVIISSLSDTLQVKELYERFGNEIRIIFVKLSDSFNQQGIFDWVQWVFIKNEQQDIDIYKRKWAISPMKERLKKNEKALEKMLNID